MTGQPDSGGSHVVPLPEHLSHCGCRLAPTTHSTTCAAARAFDETRMRDRPEYAVGERRFAMVSWEYPLRMALTVNVDVELDPVAVIVAHADEYKAFVMEPGYEGWEKPTVFLSNLIEDQVDGVDVYLGAHRHARTSIDIDHGREHPRWTPEDTEHVDAALARIPDPNQGVLNV